MREDALKKLEERLGTDSPSSEVSGKMGLITRGYSPEMAKLFGSRDIAIFVNQLHFRYNTAGNGFYKFVEPAPNATFYREGDSWCEELFMTRHEFRRCRDAVSTRTKSRAEAKELAENGTELKTLVVYYTSKSNHNITYWYFNIKLYNKLVMIASEESAKAERQKTNFGRKAKNELHITENTREYNIMENDKEFENLFDGTTVKDIDRKVSDKKREKVKAKASKPARTLTQGQLDIIREKQEGRAMPLDFAVKSSIIDQLVEEGFDYDDVITEARLFTHHYKDKHQEKTAIDWDAKFRDFWMPNSIKFKKKAANGRKGQSRANEERLEGLKRIAESSVFERVGTTDIEELGENLRSYYEEVYGGLDS